MQEPSTTLKVKKHLNRLHVPTFWTVSQNLIHNLSSICNKYKSIILSTTCPLKPKVPSKTENFKIFLTKIMLLNEMQAFFVSKCFFAMFFKSNLITFCFSLSLTWHHTNYQMIKFSWLYYNVQKETKSKCIKHRQQPLTGFPQNRFYDTLTLKEKLQKYRKNLWTSWFFKEKLVDL